MSLISSVGGYEGWYSKGGRIECGSGSGVVVMVGVGEIRGRCYYERVLIESERRERRCRNGNAADLHSYESVRRFKTEDAERGRGGNKC